MAVSSSSSSSSSSQKGLNPYAPEFIKSDERQRLLINPYASSFYYCCFSSTCFLSPVSLFPPNEFIIYPPPQFEEHHVLPVVVPYSYQPEVEVQQQHTGHGDDVFVFEELATQIKPPRRVFRGSKRGGYKGYSGRFFDRKVVGTNSSQKMEWKPAATLKSTSTTEKKVVHNKGSFVVDYSWGATVPRRMVKKFSDVLPVKKDGDGTTVMIRNIPNRYSRDLLMTFLDKHCAKENGKKSESESAFDFLYLPIDFWTAMNKGYAFVNFTNPEAVWRFFTAANGHNWDLFDSNKIREIAYARIQGKEELVEHFETMGFPCESEEVLPVIFSPARDGSSEAATVEMTCIGKLEGWNVIDKWQKSHGSRKKKQPPSSAPRFDLI